MNGSRQRGARRLAGRTGYSGVMAVAILLGPFPIGAVQAPAADTLPAMIQGRLEGAAPLVVRGRRLMAERALTAFYRARDFRPAWVDGGPPPARLEALTGAIEEAALDGLEPGDYHLEALRSLRDAQSDSARVGLELLATDAFLVLGSHLLDGRLDPVRLRAEWRADRRGADMPAVLAAALAAGDVAGALDRLRPPQAGYRALRAALARARAVERSGGWPRLEGGPALRPGDVGPPVGTLRRRLVASGDLGPGGGDGGERFDDGLEAAVRGFQERHGLEPDGVVGPSTREALAVPVAARIRQLAVNLERWRWMPQEPGRRHVLVNIPEFIVEVREDGEVVMRLRAIVGLEYRQTPVFSGRMTHVIFSPYWNIPAGIAVRDKLPSIREDPSTLARQGMTLLDRRTGAVVDPAAVDWSALTAEEFTGRYRLRQAPGPLNALGAVKFIFPNPYDVYLHDTPSRELFDRRERTFSSGCIRVERPLELAAYLLREHPSWNAERTRRAVEGRVETRAALTAEVPVHVQYWTAFVDARGRVNYRRDVYGRDAAVAAALEAGPPGP